MPRQRTQYRRRTYEFPDDFPERLKRFQEESGLSWSEIDRRIGTYRHRHGQRPHPPAKPGQTPPRPSTTNGSPWSGTISTPAENCSRRPG